MTHAVRVASPDEVGEAVAVACRAFWPDPLLSHFARSPLHEYQAAPTFFGVLVRDRLPYAELSVVDIGGRIGGVALWVPPGRLPRPGWEQARTALKSAPGLVRARHRRQAVRLLNAVERAHPHEPHWYLALLGTDPAAQGTGVGSALLAPVLAQCDEQGEVAYLETQKQANVAWYARHGFAETGTVELPGVPKVWLLTRQPRAE